MSFSDDSKLAFDFIPIDLPPVNSASDFERIRAG